MAAAAALAPPPNSQLFTGAESSFNNAIIPNSSFSSTLGSSSSTSSALQHPPQTQSQSQSQNLSSTMDSMTLGLTTSETLSSAHDLLAAHTALVSRIREGQKRLKQVVQALQRQREELDRENALLSSSSGNHGGRKRRRSSTATAVDDTVTTPGEEDDYDERDTLDREVYGDDDDYDRISVDYDEGRSHEVKREEEDGADTRLNDDDDDRQTLDDAASNNDDVYASSEEDDYDPTEPPPRVIRSDLPPAKRARVQRYANYIPEEETIRNDYSQRYVDGGEWPQNWVLGAEPERRFEEYPKQQRLLNLKKQSVNQHSLPPHYLSLPPAPPTTSTDSYYDTTTTTSTSTNAKFQTLLSTLHPSKFDVILIDPPFSSSFTWDNLQDLPIPSLAGDPSFVFLWVGSGAGEGLERGREVLAKWGYRRCEDVVWVKTNKTSNKGPGTDPPTTSLLTRTKQHCLMGIRGTVRRSNDSWFVHCNVDTDVIIWEGDASDPARKPPEMYTLIENFCLGMRRLEIFGRLSSLRRGWVTVLAPGQEAHLPRTSSSFGEANNSSSLGLGLRAANSTSSSASSSSANLALGAETMNSTLPLPAKPVDVRFHVDGEEGGLARRWERERWEEGIRDMAGPAGVASTASGGTGGGAGKFVVPMTPEIDALRPKSPVRGDRGGGGGGDGGGPRGNGGGSHHQHHHGQNNAGGGMNMNMGMVMGMNMAGGGAMGMGGGNGMSMMAQPMSISGGVGGVGSVMRFAGGNAGIMGGNNNGRSGGGFMNNNNNAQQGMSGMGMLGPGGNQLMAQPIMGAGAGAMNNMGMNAMNMNVANNMNSMGGMDGTWNNGIRNPMMGMGMNMHMGVAGGGTAGVGAGGMNPMMSMAFGQGGGAGQLGMLANNNNNMNMAGMDTGWDNGMGMNMGMGMGGMGMHAMGGGGMPGMGMGMNNMGMGMPGMVGLGNGMGMGALGMMGMSGMNMGGGGMGINQRQQQHQRGGGAPF